MKDIINILKEASAVIRDTIPEGYTIDVQNIGGSTETVCLYYNDNPCEDFLDGTLGQKVDDALRWAITDSKA